MEEVLLNTHYLKVSYNARFNFIHLIWKKTAELEEYQRSFIELLEFARLNPVDTFLADLEELKVLDSDNRKWFENEILPIAINDIKLKRAAILVSNKKEQLSYARFIQASTYEYDFPFKIFYSKKKAFKWLHYQSKWKNVIFKILQGRI
jgi:hypothetical protein